MIVLSLGVAGCAADEPAAVEPVEIRRRQEARFGDAIRLLGFEMGPPVIHPLGVIELTLFWEAEGPVEGDYLVFAEVIGPSGDAYARKERVPMSGARPTSSWLPGETIVDSYSMALRGDGHPGFYRVWIAMLDPESGMQPLPVYVNGERAPEDAIRLEMVIEAEP
jgi:hypothetical protein